ncbi:glycosyltransferase [Cohnella sp. WQ 127256]|uniref:glycosyltransferase n=1 Tax=Cohnella sp. WQ 127256 TaxID=2938790 RepID=UPI002117EE2C|nr:glycosyltransferase [Cohnella sp. WQ 127256]
MALKKKQRSRKGRKVRPVLVSTEAYKQGHIEGFQRGKEDGFVHGRSIAIKMLEGVSANRVAKSEHSTMDVLVITAGIIPSLEIGVIQPLSALNHHENIQYDVKLEHEVNKEMIAAAKTIVFVRNVEPAAYTLLEWAQELGKRTVYVIDDNFLEIQPTTPVGLYYADPVLRETFIKFLKNAHIVKVDAQDLGAYIHEKFNSNVVYFPASVDFQWLDEQERRDREAEQIVIGYEGGAKEEDFAPVIPALKKILDYYGGFVRLEFYGYIPDSLISHPSVSYEEGGMEYKSFIQKLNVCNWDIGLAPLGDNLFNKGKTNNKMREYGACRIPGIYSNSPVYTPWVTHGETGYLVPHTEEGWFEGIKEMIENPSMRLGIRGNAEIAARHHFSLNTCMENWKKYILEA